MLDLSVIICTHNPRAENLQRVLAALGEQTLPKDCWELLLIDNASETPLAATWNLCWHPNARHVREDELGLTPARLSGIREAKGDLLAFVDDDNVLAANYLETALRIRQSMPQVEVLGGQVAGEFEIPPEPWMETYLPLLAIRELKRDCWSNDPMRFGFYPCGAGMCVTKNVAASYADMLRRDPRRKSLGRRGAALTSGEDNDICFTAGHAGCGVGLFRSLSLVHLIPKSRLDESYLLRIAEEIDFSGYILAYLWNQPTRPPVHSLRWRFGYWRMRRSMSNREKRFADARVRAESRAARAIQEMETVDS